MSALLRTAAQPDAPALHHQVIIRWRHVDTIANDGLALRRDRRAERSPTGQDCGKQAIAKRIGMDDDEDRGIELRGEQRNQFAQ